LLVALLLLGVCAPLGWAAAQSPAPPDIARGRHIATALAGCADCHGPTFAGGRAFGRGDGTVYSANLTGGKGGIGSDSDADLRRLIRAGVRPDGSRLRVMPTEYALMTDADLDDLIAFLRSLPPVDRSVPRAAPAAAASAPSAVAAPSSQSAGAHPETSAAPLTGGAYLVTLGGCTNCHGANLAGGARPNGSFAPNISHDGIGAWSFADFRTAMRTGQTPAGRTLATTMPWQSIGGMTDAELRAVYDYLEAARPTAPTAITRRLRRTRRFRWSCANSSRTWCRPTQASGP
jgi:cytochrome c553